MAKPVVLAILDGWGVAPPGPGNAAFLAKTPHLDRLFETRPHAQLLCSGEAVGLPAGQQGNSEVGHLNLGAGRVVYQDLLRIDRDIRSGRFVENPVLAALIDGVRARGRTLHLMGLLSDGGVHSHQEHLFAVLEMAKKRGLEDVAIHAFMDGRDVPPRSGKGYIETLMAKLSELGIGRIATISGRYYAMDRDHRWERVRQAYDALVHGQGVFARDPVQAMAESYANDVSDEFVLPVVLCDEEGSALAPLSNGDGVLFYNFRADRARELTHALVDPDFTGFADDLRPELHMVTMTEYEAGMEAYLRIAYPQMALPNTLGEWLAKQGCPQLRTAETEKYAHVTFFFNGSVEAPNEGEVRTLIPSPAVATYDLQPEMSAPAVADVVCEAIAGDAYAFILVNFANPDMVGHTGHLPAAIQAVETVDAAIGKILAALDQTDGAMLICADHGNCERMQDENGQPVTAHTTNPVPVILVSKDDLSIANGSLSDVAPTVLELMNLPIPNEMTGQSLLQSERRLDK